MTKDEADAYIGKEVDVITLRGKWAYGTVNAVDDDFVFLSTVGPIALSQIREIKSHDAVQPFRLQYGDR